MKKEQTYSLIGHLLDSDEVSAAILAYYLLKGMKEILIPGRGRRIYSYKEEIHKDRPGEKAVVLRNWNGHEVPDSLWADWYLIWREPDNPNHLVYENPEDDIVYIPIT